jgi:hypothetical protein
VDYGFAPGLTPQDGRARNLFARRANTTLVASKALTTVRGFANRLLTSGTVTRPIDDALIGAHASSEGWLKIAMFPGQKGATKYETLEDALATASKSIAIDDTVIGHSPGDPITHNVHFKGCNIGKAPVFLTKFKEALGGNVTVTAPKHFHGLYELDEHGTFEYMSYEFSVQRKSPFATRAALLTALDAAAFTFIDGSAVPTTSWAKWVPKKIGKTLKWDVTRKLGVTIGKVKTISPKFEFRATKLPFVWEIEFSGGPAPSTTTARQAAFEGSVGGDAAFQSTHAYPWYERTGFATIGDFFAGHTWKHTVKNNTLFTVGSRVEYTVVLPITDMTTGDLVFNFHPLPTKPYAPIINLDETDSTYFESV